MSIEAQHLGSSEYPISDEGREWVDAEVEAVKGMEDQKERLSLLIGYLPIAGSTTWRPDAGMPLREGVELGQAAVVDALVATGTNTDGLETHLLDLMKQKELKYISDNEKNKRKWLVPNN